MAVIQNVPQPIWQTDRMGFSGRTERNVRDLSHASVLVFAGTAVATGILASISLSSDLGIGVTSSFVVVAVLFPLLCGWLARERWRANRLEDQIRGQFANQGFARGPSEYRDGHSPADLLIVSSDLRIHFANQTFLRNALQEPEEVLGWKIQDILSAEGLEDRANTLLESSDPAASCCFDAFARAGLAGKRAVHITMARIAPWQGEDRVLVVVEDLLPGCSPRSGLSLEGYVC